MNWNQSNNNLYCIVYLSGEYYTMDMIDRALRHSSRSMTISRLENRPPKGIVLKWAWFVRPDINTGATIIWVEWRGHIARVISRQNNGHPVFISGRTSQASFKTLPLLSFLNTFKNFDQKRFKILSCKKINPCVWMNQSGAPLAVSISCDINTGKNQSDCTNCLKCLRMFLLQMNGQTVFGFIFFMARFAYIRFFLAVHFHVSF